MRHDFLNFLSLLSVLFPKLFFLCLFILSLLIYFILGIRAVVPNFVQIDVLDIKENLMKIEKAGVSFPVSKLTLLRCCKLLFSLFYIPDNDYDKDLM